MKKTVITNSYLETQKLGSDFASKINNIRVLALYGDLGSGKTSFIQGLAKGLDINKRIISPTFIIMRSYNIDLNHQSSNINHFLHVDLYRIKNVKDIEELGLIELLNDPQNLLAIEWPEKIKSLLPQNIIEIFFEYLNENKRKITIT